MALQPIHVELTPSDYLGLATAITLAFDKSAYQHTIFPNSTIPELVHNEYLRLPHNIYEAGRLHLKILDPITNDIMCYSRWKLSAIILAELEDRYPRPKPTVQEVKQMDKDFRAGSDENGNPKGVNLVMVDEGRRNLEKAKEEVFPKCDHIYLSGLITRPSYQGKGYASTMIKWGIDLADEKGLPILLQATAEAKGFYKKHGFILLKDIEHDLSIGGGQGTYTHSLMMRERQ